MPILMAILVAKFNYLRGDMIFLLIRIDGDTTATKMAKLFGISKRTIDREISFLRKNGYIRKETKDNRSPWLVVKES